MSNHFHISNGTELTLAATSKGMQIAFDTFMKDACTPEVSGIDIRTEYLAGSATNVTVDHPETEVTVIRTRMCDDPTCEKALEDYWL